MTERLHFHFPLSCIGEGNGNPLQCPCLENPRDGGAWWAAIYGVAQSRTRLKRLSSSSDLKYVVHLSFFFFNLILFNFTILYWFCHISKWICHRYTCEFLKRFVKIKIATMLKKNMLFKPISVTSILIYLHEKYWFIFYL